jgi:phosphohistidine swiveling domain-containing protein
MTRWAKGGLEDFYDDAAQSLEEYEALARDIIKTLPPEEWPQWVKNYVHDLTWGKRKPIDWTPYDHEDALDARPGDLTLPDSWGKVAAGGPMVPANYTPEDPLDLQGKQPLFDAMDTQWWTLPPEEAERAVINAFRATMLSPRMNLKGNAVLYQSLMNVDPHESDPQVFENIIRDLKARWDAQGQTGMGQEPTDVMSVDEILPGKFQPGIWTNIRRIAALGPYADEIYKAALIDMQQYGGSGRYFRDRILQLNIPGIKAKVASFAWLALAPNTSELGTIDVHMMRHLGEESDSPRNTTHYMQLEDQLRQERDDTYGTDVPLSKYQWGVWDKRRTPGFHQDHSPLRAIDPTPYTDVYWAPTPRPPRDVQPQQSDPNQMSLMGKVGWQIVKNPLSPAPVQWYKPLGKGDWNVFVYYVEREVGEANNPLIHDEVLRLTQGMVPGFPSSHSHGWETNRRKVERDNFMAGVKEIAQQLPVVLQNQIPAQDYRSVNDQEHADQFYNGIVPRDPTMRSQYPRQYPQRQIARWSMLRTGGHTLQGQVVGAQGNVQGVAIRMDQQTPEEILQMLAQLPTHEQDYQKQREMIPGWAINRGGKVADFDLTPDATGFTYGAGAIVVAEWVDVNDNWLLYHGAVQGIVAGKGGATSHGVVVARERNIPIIVNVQDWDSINAGDTLQMDATTGIIDVNGGSTEQQTQEVKQAEEPVIAFVWSQGHGVYQPVPAGSAGAAALHREMIAEMRHAMQFNKKDYSMGVVYADGRVQQVGSATDQEAMEQWLNTVYPTKNEPALTV